MKQEYIEIAELLFPQIKNDISFYENLYKDRKLNSNSMVTRFAPSPTGFVHMGSLYVSFINSIFAKRSNGVFYVRIEDTDQVRIVEDGISSILRDLKDFDIIPDEGVECGGDYGPYIQSKRMEIYQTYAKHMISLGLAYPCFCTKEELENIRLMQEENKLRIGYYGDFARYRNITKEEVKKHLENKEQFVIRFKSLGSFDNTVNFHDEIKGDITFPENDIDVVLLKSDFLPTYHFAHVIDDHLMRTTCVIRGDEWLSSIPLHLQLFKALSFDVPKYAHISPLTKKDGDIVRKLSKRKDPECSVKFYEEQGIPSDVIKLYFAQIINYDFEEWYLKNSDKNILEFPFKFSHMAEGGSLFDLEKLYSISKDFFAKRTAEEIYLEALEFYKKHEHPFYELLDKYKDYSISVLNIERGNERSRKDIAKYSDIYDEFWYMYDEEFFNRDLKLPDMNQNIELSMLEEYIINIYDIEDSEEEWLNKLKEFGRKYNFCDSVKEYKKNKEQYFGHFGDICNYLRVVITTKTMTPNLYDILKLLGKSRIIKRIEFFRNK